ncbi:MAG: SDR family oxidoreductase [Planctomycetales bacterium]|nr:SDR family oxidoreductase [Planctomycetales bacterium]
MAKLIVGCGYLGLRVARLWRDLGEQVYVLTRSADKADKLVSEGFSAVVADINSLRDTGQNLFPTASFSTVLYSVGYDRKSPQPIEQVYAGGLANLLDSPALNSAAAPMCRWIYISSTGVYGSADGEWVDEETPPQPAREGGKASLAAEQVLRSHPLGSRSIILRLAGIYGPGRIPRAADLQAGRPIDAPAEGWLNLIHVDDAARIVLLADQNSAVPNLFCVADGSPAQRGDYYRELARLLSAPEPQFVTPDPNSPASLRAGSDKRVRPAKLFRELAPQLHYPSYREGLAAIVNF